MPTRLPSGAAVRLLAVLCVTAGCAAAQQQQQQQPSTGLGSVFNPKLYIEKTVQDELQSLVSRIDSIEQTMRDEQQSLVKRLTKLDSQQSQLAVLTDTCTCSEQSRLDRAINQTASQQTQIDELAVRLDQLESEGGPGGSEPLPRDCSELPAGARSAVNLLQPGLNRSQPPVQAYCDLDTDGGHWTVFQRRANIEPHQDFYLGWAAYKEGFGELRGEFWWGLEKLWRMTSAQDRQYELRIDLEGFEGEKQHAVYQDFRISSEEDGYRLLSADNYTGDAGDSLIPHVNSKFSTPDRDQDSSSGYHCAEYNKGAWWYSERCGLSSLNGPYQDRPANGGKRIWWYTWEAGLLKKVEMKIRRT